MSNIMRTSTSGMNAQSSKLAAVSQNIANSDTTGYKRSGVEFSSLILPQTGGSYNSGSVMAQVRTEVSKAGSTVQTGNANNPKQLDMMIQDDGFLVVGDGKGSYLTRAGSFRMQPDGTLVNAAGYTLKGYPMGANGTDATLNGFAGLEDVNLNTGLLSANPTTEGTLTVPLDQAFVTGPKATGSPAAAFSVTGVTSSGTPANDRMNFTVTIDGGTPIAVSVGSATGLGGITAADVATAINNAVGKPVATVNAGKLVYTATGDRTGTASTIAVSNPTFTGATAATIAGVGMASTPGTAATDPAANLANAISGTSTRSVSMTVYNNAGEAVPLHVYYTKTDDATNTWKMAIFDGRDASTGTATSPFPYGVTGSAPLATATLQFDPSTYKLTKITPGANTTQANNTTLGISLTGIGGGNLNLDIGATTQFYKPDSSALTATVNGNPPEVVQQVQIGKDGTITALFTSGTQRDLFKIPVAKVMAPDSLVALSGNVYQPGVESGQVLMGTGGENGFGEVTAGALEGSNVDLASELTDMITAQRSYTANSKVFQTGSEILDVLVNLKR
ncbi:flagellar hook-basal body complex protein [Aureimonas leprariae]|uniref:Flagellar hook protein FlgE n=1 Tax=Plantimonas leprariae TaxID=2615207 RepID=A0A7V7PPI1_9HYPH|nr:flagellar hook-basal body complex protein [Aureimonas leprariae]KAB0679897.1 flagellar hook-basal body complex protein [Aureimonas leprariae]